MTRKIYDPPIATRIKKSTYDYIVGLAQRRSEKICAVVATAIYEYEKKCREIDEAFKNN